jgi:hypothetical protein
MTTVGTNDVKMRDSGGSGGGIESATLLTNNNNTTSNGLISEAAPNQSFRRRIIDLFTRQMNKTRHHQDETTANEMTTKKNNVTAAENEGDEEVPRIQWDSFSEYFLSIIGFVIDLGNVWRFPTVCYQNGGGAFLIPFLVCLFIIGMPCMYLELAVGQYFRLGNISVWAKVSPWMKGIGWSIIIVNVLMLSYYNTLQAYALYYLAFSFSGTQVPWSSCTQSWNTPLCQTRDSNVSNL